MATVEQQRALALAAARKRAAEQKPKTRSEQAKEGLTYLAGMFEPVLQMGSAAVAEPIAGLAGIGAAAVPGGRSGPEAVEGVRNAMTYQPRTEGGQRFSEAISKPFQGFERGMDSLVDAASQSDNRGYFSGVQTPQQEARPAAQTALKTILMGAPAVVGGRGAIKAVPEPKPKPARAPAIEELNAQAQVLYDKADNSGVVVSGDSFDRFIGKLEKRMADEGIDAGQHPQAIASLQRLMDRRKNNFSLKGLEIERRNVNDVLQSQNAGDRRMGAIIREQLDDYIDNLGPNDTLAGDAATAVKTLKEARDIWRRKSKGETIEQAMEMAGVNAGTYTGAGFENALRIEFRKLARRGVNDKRVRRQFTDAEWQAIRKVANGGAIENLARWFGKFAPNNAVGFGIGMTLGGMGLGPVGAVAAPVAGAIGKRIATKRGIRNAEEVSEMVRRESP